MTHSNAKTIHTLEQQIAAARQRLQELYDARGCTDAVVLAASIEVDELLNEQYRRLHREKQPAAKGLLQNSNEPLRQGVKE